MQISDHLSTVKETIRASFDNYLHSPTILGELQSMPKTNKKASHLCLERQISCVIGHCYLTLDGFLSKNSTFTEIELLTAEKLDDITLMIQLHKCLKRDFNILKIAMSDYVREYIEHHTFWHQQISDFIKQCQYINKNFFIALCPSHFKHSDPCLSTSPTP